MSHALSLLHGMRMSVQADLSTIESEAPVVSLGSKRVCSEGGTLPRTCQEYSVCPCLHVEHASIRQYAAGMVWRCLVHSINLSLLCTTVLALFTATMLTNLRAAAFLRATSNW